MLRRELAVDPLRQREIAGVRRKLEPGPHIALVQHALVQHRVEQRIAGFRRLGPGEPQPLRLRQGFGALRDQALLQGVADEFGVLFLRQRIFLHEQVPRALLAQRLQPVAAQPVGKQRIALVGQEAAHRVRIRIVDTEFQLPVPRVGRERIAVEQRRELVQPGGIARAKRVPCRQKIAVRVRRRRDAPGAACAPAAMAAASSIPGIHPHFLLIFFSFISDCIVANSAGLDKPGRVAFQQRGASATIAVC